MNKLHLVPNLEKILQNVSSSYKILVKFLAGESAHAPKVTIFKVLLLKNGKDWGNQTFRDESQDHDLGLGSERESTEHNQAKKLV